MHAVRELLGAHASARVLVCTALLGVLVPRPAGAEGAAGANPARGREVYASYCVQCHGERGDGRGRIGKIEPAPRDFARGNFKFGGSDRDLYEVITHGAAIKGGDPIMASWAEVISEPDRWALVAFIRSLKK
jgi:mono/diheme cytochrome c family protein